MPADVDQVKSSLDAARESRKPSAVENEDEDSVDPGEDAVIQGDQDSNSAV